MVYFELKHCLHGIWPITEKSLIPATNVSNMFVWMFVSFKPQIFTQTDQQLRKALFMHQMCQGIRRKVILKTDRQLRKAGFFCSKCHRIWTKVIGKTREKSLSCSQCKKGFKQMGHLSHKLTHKLTLWIRKVIVKTDQQLTKALFLLQMCQRIWTKVLENWHPLGNNHFNAKNVRRD